MNNLTSSKFVTQKDFDDFIIEIGIELSTINHILDDYQQKLERLEKALEKLKTTCDEILEILKLE